MKKYIVAFIIVTILLGVFTAFNSDLEINNISGLMFSYKMLYIDLGVILVLFLLSLVGIPSYLFYLLFSLFGVGVLSYLFICSYFLKGLLYIFVYFLFFKIPLYFLLILNLFYTLKYAKNLYRFLFNKFGRSIKSIKVYFKKLVVVNIIMYFLCVFNTIIGGKLMQLLANYLHFG